MEKNICVFGPVPSRRFGMSLGVNNIPAKQCTYSCVYCQIGKTSELKVKRKHIYKSSHIQHAVAEAVKKCARRGQTIDYITFVSSGEPTLDENIGTTITMLKPFGIKIAVITNASLLWDKKVQDDLCSADCVSVKIDAVSSSLWKRINRPHPSLSINNILQGIVDFSRIYPGMLITETMILKDCNDDFKELENIAHFIASLRTAKSYIAIPTRPPAELSALPADSNSLNTAYWLFYDRHIHVEYLIDYEGNEFAVTDTVEKMVLSITAVHPLREDALDELLKKTQSDWSVIDALIQEQKLTKTIHKGKKYFIKKTNQ